MLICSPDLGTLKFQLLHHPVGSLQRSKSFWFMDAGPFAHFHVLAKKSYRMTSGWVSMRMHDTVENFSSALDSVQRSGSELHGNFVGVTALKKQNCVECGGGGLERDEVCLYSGKVRKEGERSRAALSVKRWFARMLSMLFREERLASFADYVMKRMCVDCVHVSERSLRMLFVNPGIVFEGLFTSIDDYGESLNAFRAWRTELYVLREQRTYASQKFEAHNELSNSFLLTQEESDWKKKM